MQSELKRKIILRRANENDVDLLFDWANDKETRRNSFCEDEISYETHVAWLNELLKDNNRVQLIMEEDGEPVGQIRLSFSGDVAEIGYSVEPKKRGCGYGKVMLTLVLEYVRENLPDVKKIVGQVKPSNVASYKAFVSCGFFDKYRLLEYDYSEYKELEKESFDKKAGGVLLLTNNKNAIDLFDWIATKKQVDLYSDKLTIEVLEYYKPDLIISYNYSHIIKPEVIEHANGNIINMHISYLPWNRGSNPNFWSFVENTPKGVTIHKLDAGLDTGDIIYQERIEFDETKETLETTYNILQKKIVELLKQNWDNIVSKQYRAKPQEKVGSYHALVDYAKYKEEVRFDVPIKDLLKNFANKI